MALKFTPELRQSLRTGTQTFNTEFLFRFYQLSKNGIVDLDQETSDIQQLICLTHLLFNDTKLPDEIHKELKRDATLDEDTLALNLAIRAEIDEDYETAFNHLKPWIHRGSPWETEFRLIGGRLAIELGDFEEAHSLIKPLTQPPGVEATLEAQFLELIATIRLAPMESTMMEKVATIDLLLDRNFRVREPRRVLSLAKILDQYNQTGIIEKYLQAHRNHLLMVNTDEPEDLEFLIKLGSEYNLTEPVQAAGRCYLETPFAWRKKDAGSCAAVLNGAGEHEAAETLILESYTHEEITANPSLWSQLLLTAYYQGKFSQALEIYQNFHDMIAQLPLLNDLQAIHAALHYYQGNFAKSLSIFESNVKIIRENGSAQELACWVVSAAAEGKLDQIPPLMDSIIRNQNIDNHYRADFCNHVLHEICLLNLDKALDQTIIYLANTWAPNTVPPSLIRVGDLAVSWSMPWGARTAAALLEERNEEGLEAYMRAIAATDEGHWEEASRHFLSALELTKDANYRITIQLAYLRALRLYKRYEEALAFYDKIEWGIPPDRQYAFLAFRLGLLEETGTGINEMTELKNSLTRAIQAGLPPGTPLQSRESEVSFYIRGEGPIPLLTMINEIKSISEIHPEIPRLCRKVINSPTATDEEKALAEEINNNWWKHRQMPTEEASHG